MSRRYELRYTNVARKDIENLDGSIRKRMLKVIEAPAEDPRSSGCVPIKGQVDM